MSSHIASVGIRKFVPIFLANVFLSLHYASTLYVNSSFLGGLFPRTIVTALFVVGAVGNIALFFNTPKIIGRFGRQKTLTGLLVAEAIAVLGIAISSTNISTAVFFFFHAAILPVVYYVFDIFLEDISSDSKTGEIRGLYLTTTNIAIAMSPLLISLLVAGDNLQVIYFASFILTWPILILSLFLRRKRPEPAHKRIANLPLRMWWRNGSVRKITLLRFVLEFFYTIMVIFTPIYLRNYIGFEWSEIGIMFTIMLLPFVFFQWPIGELADRKLGEKEILIFGLLLAGFALVAMPFLGKAFVAWTTILFISRIGASWIEVAAESYFFKHVTSSDVGLITIYRMTRPVSIVLGALFGGIITLLMPFEAIFIALALVIFLSIIEAGRLRDTL